jgi:hypothetical protein
MEMRYCKDCEHFDPLAAVGREPVCTRFKREFVLSEDPVRGPRMGFSAPDCAVARGEKGQCGPQARFYVSRPGTDVWMAEREAKKEVLTRHANGELTPLSGPSLWQRIVSLFP